MVSTTKKRYYAEKTTKVQEEGSSSDEGESVQVYQKPKKLKKSEKKAVKEAVAVDNESSEDEDTIEKELKAPKAKKVQKRTKGKIERGVIYIKHLPHGFYEKELRKYMTQFGSVTNLRLGRSKKTGNSKGYAFVEFKFPEVATIVAETMNNYLMFDRLVKCEVVPADKVQSKIFAGKVNVKNPPGVKRRREAKKIVNADKTETQKTNRLRRNLRKLEKLQLTLAKMGIESTVDFNDVKDNLPKTGRTPTMEVDDSDGDITMKTPPKVRKIKSRSNSAAATPSSKVNTPTGVVMGLSKDKKAKLFEKLTAHLDETENKTPKSAKKAKNTPKASTPVSLKKAKDLPLDDMTPKALLRKKQLTKLVDSTLSKTPKVANETPKSAKKNGKGTPSKATPAKATPAKTTPAKVIAKATPAKAAKDTPKSVKKSAKKSPKGATSMVKTPNKKMNVSVGASPQLSGKKKAKTPKK